MMSREECLAKYGSDYQIQKRIQEGMLYQVGKAVYSEEANVPYIAVLAFKYPKAVVTMQSAFYMHGLTDVIPDDYDLATDRDAAKIHDEHVRQFFLPKEILQNGIVTLDYKGYKIPVYSKERMLIELLRYKSKLPFDYYKEVLLNYRKIMPGLSVQEVQEYALIVPKSDKVLRTLQLEVL